MKKLSMALLGAAIASTSANAFEEQLNMENNTLETWVPSTVLATSPLKYDVIFVGGADMVQHTAIYGGEAGMAPAKQWHDFIGFTPANDDDKARIPGVYGFVSVNHERIQNHDEIGDGGGMTVFAVGRTDDDRLEVLEQTIEGRGTAKFFNVDFVNTVGETGMNCGGITAPDGRIWTAEEWWQSSLDGAFRDTVDFVIGETTPNGFPGYNGETLERVANLNYMVEIDPRSAAAVRKQYNWGRQPFEGGAITDDMTTAYLGADATPGLFTKFVADTPGDFTSGTTYVYKQNQGSYAGTWVEMDMDNFDNVPNFTPNAFAVGGTGFNRIEWVAIDPNSGLVYFTETGRDNPGSRLEGAVEAGGDIAYHHYQRATEQGLDSPFDGDYWDYYGRIMVYNPATNECMPFLEGGPFFDVNSSNHFEDGNNTDGSLNQDFQPYPEKHLTNPDGLNFLNINGKSIMVICEDLNGTSYGRVKPGIGNRTCELFVLDMEKEATIDNLVRVGIVPVGAEVTGACPTPDGKNLLVNSQHPATYNEYPYNNSLTFVLTGWDEFINTSVQEEGVVSGGNDFGIFPNPTTREIRFNVVTDAALYDVQGKRLKVVTNTDMMDVREFGPGTYFVKNAAGDVQKLIIE